jgi:hypothetical protein
MLLILSAAQYIGFILVWPSEKYFELVFILRAGPYRIGINSIRWAIFRAGIHLLTAQCSGLALICARWTIFQDSTPKHSSSPTRLLMTRNSKHLCIDSLCADCYNTNKMPRVVQYTCVGEFLLIF